MVAFAALLFAGCVACPWRALPSPSGALPVLPIYVVKHFWHAGIIVRRADVPEGAWPAERALPPSRYVEVGWGDRAYWTAPRATIGLALNAIAGPSPSVLRFVMFDRPVADYAGRDALLAVDVSSAQLAALSRFIQQSYAESAEQPILVYRAAAGDVVEFYPGRGHYDLFHTSNHWTAEALQMAGLHIDARGVVLAGQVVCQVRRLADEVATPQGIKRP